MNNTRYCMTATYRILYCTDFSNTTRGATVRASYRVRSIIVPSGKSLSCQQGIVQSLNATLAEALLSLHVRIGSRVPLTRRESASPGSTMTGERAGPDLAGMCVHYTSFMNSKF